jgi:hypothetical protein
MKRERRKPTRAEWERMIPGERILGKFSHQESEWAAALSRSSLVTKTSGGIFMGGGG